MKKIAKILGLILIVCSVVVTVTLVIGGRDGREPDVADLAPQKTPVPAEQNAYKEIVALADSMVLAKKADIILQYIEGKSVGQQMANDFLKNNAKVLEKLDKILALKYCQAPEGSNLEYIKKYYQVAILLAVRCVNDYNAGRIDSATRSAIALIHYGDMIHPVSQNLTDYNAGTEILQLGLKQARTIILSNEVTSEDLSRLAEVLKSLNDLDPGLIRAIKFKFEDVDQQIRTFREKKVTIEEAFGAPDMQFLPFFLRKTKWYPGYIFRENESRQRLADLYKVMLKNAGNNYAGMEIFNLENFLGLQDPGSLIFFYTKPNFIGKIFYAFTTPEFYTFLETKCQSKGAIQATKLMVAIRAYQKEKGELPDNLDQLLPDYITEIPLDSFDGKPLRYSKEKQIIYSVSKDLKDSKGSMKVPEGEIYGDDYPRLWITEDAVFQLQQ